MPLDFLFVLGLGLTGSLHCAGMCGGLVCAYAIPAVQTSEPLWRYHSIYILGRLFIYSWIGAMMGVLGMLLAKTFTPESWIYQVGNSLAGAIMIIGGIVIIFGGQWPHQLNRWLIPGMNRVIAALQAVGKRLGRWRFFSLGMLSGFLPCGLMWAVELKAFAAQSLFYGMFLMTFFCVVTTPSLLLTGSLLAKISPYLRLRSMQLSGVIVLLMGLHLLLAHQ